MPKQLQLKIRGPKGEILDFIENLKKSYVILPTSGIIDHPEDDNVHIFVTIVEVG